MSYSYQKYLEEYSRQKRTHESKGHEMALGPWREEEFEYRILEKKAMIAGQIAEGKRKGYGNLYQQLVSSQRWKTSKSNARNFSKAFQTYNRRIDEETARLRAAGDKEGLRNMRKKIHIDLEDIQLLDVRHDLRFDDFWDDIKNARDTYKLEHPNLEKGELAAFIGREFFGSP